MMSENPVPYFDKIGIKTKRKSNAPNVKSSVEKESNDVMPNLQKIINDLSKDKYNQDQG